MDGFATTVLLVEDNLDIQKANRRMLELNGFQVYTALSVAQARECLAYTEPDALVLDVMLPDGSGIAFCQELRTHSDIPVLFLTAMDDRDDIVKGLRAGGDDYITKPYDFEELLARLEAILRRYGHQHRRTASTQTIGDIRIDYLVGRVYLHGEDVLLKPKEFALLLAFMDNRGQYLSPRKLYEIVWGGIDADDPRTVYVHLAGLRKKLQMTEDSVLNIEHIRGQGYCLRVLRQTNI